MKELFMIGVGAALINNVVLSQFLGILCLSWCIQEDRNGSRNGRGSHFCHHPCRL